MKSLRTALLVFALCAVTLAQEHQTPAPVPSNRDILKGEINVSVRSQSKADQSYALYLPSSYHSDHKWPVVYVFDPGARGALPLKLMKDAAERYGYILVGSNNSRNGNMQPQLDAASNMWSDTHTYLPIDERRVYFAGFSGGARVAADLALLCKCARAVFLNGAGLMPGGPQLPKENFAAFLISGRNDFNYGEMLDLDAKLESAGLPHFLRRFDGDHQWGPASVWGEAFAWTALLEMKNNLRPRDAEFIASELSKSTERYRKQIESGEPSFALQEARGVGALYLGLSDTTAVSQQIAALEKDPATRARIKQEKSEIERQQTLGQDIYSAIVSLDKVGAEQITAVSDTISKIHRLREEFEKTNNASNRRVYQRTLGSILSLSMGTGSDILRKGEFEKAIPYFEIGAEARPDSSWPPLSLAQCHAAKSDKKATIRDLKRALETGYTAQALTNFMKQDPKLAAMMEQDEYKTLIAQSSTEDNTGK